jgi:hypothetical protein
MLLNNDRPRKYEERPHSCRQCGAQAWWNGSRVVTAVRKTGDGSVDHDSDSCRRRACCSSRNCPAGSWTVYEHNDYPHRLFQLDLLVSAVSMVAIGLQTMTATAAEHLCSRDSVRRWVRWVEALAEPRDLEQLCARLDPDGLPPPTGSERGGRAERVLLLLERLAELLALRGLVLPERGPGLARLLSDRLARFSEVFFLTKSSPPLRADLTGVCL